MAWPQALSLQRSTPPCDHDYQRICTITRFPGQSAYDRVAYQDNLNPGNFIHRAKDGRRKPSRPCAIAIGQKLPAADDLGVGRIPPGRPAAHVYAFGGALPDRQLGGGTVARNT